LTYRRSDPDRFEGGLLRPLIYASLVLAICGSASSQNSSPNSPKSSNPSQPIVITQPIEIVADSSSKSGATFVLVKNASRSPAQVWLTAGDLKSSITGKLITAKITFAEEAETATKPSFKRDFKASEIVRIRVEAANVTESGVGEAVLLNNADPIGRIVVVNEQVPYNVKLGEAALVAGAREQIVKLDILPGMIAVFLAGFGADTIKNLITQGPGVRQSR